MGRSRLTCVCLHCAVLPFATVDKRDTSWKALVGRYGQLAINIVLFAVFCAGVADQTRTAWKHGRLNYVEIAFVLQNLIMVAFILVRRDPKAVDRSAFRQLVALIAFFSGAAMMGQPSAGGAAATVASELVTFAANVLGALTLLNLGRSFGILIAFRKVKTTWLYGIVRHPMYGTDILLRIGFLIGHASLYTAAVVALSSAAYVYRAILEERFLSRQPEYRSYMERVRYRFVPFVF